MPSDVDWDEFRSKEAVRRSPQSEYMLGVAQHLTEDDREALYPRPHDPFYYGHEFVEKNREGGKTFKRGDVGKC